MKLYELNANNEARRVQQYKEFFTPELFLSRYDDVMAALAKTIKGNKLIRLRGILEGTLNTVSDADQDEFEIKLIGKYMAAKFGSVGENKFVKGSVESRIPSGCFDRGVEEHHRIMVEKTSIFKITMAVTCGRRSDPTTYMTTQWKNKTAASPEEAMKQIDVLYDYLVKETAKAGLKPGLSITPKRTK